MHSKFFVTVADRQEVLLEAYRRAHLIRHAEEEIARRYHPSGDPSAGPMRTPTHLSVGQECVAVGVALACPPRTHVWLTHRTHGPYLAFGGDLDSMIAELFGKSTGCSGGWGGSMHIFDSNAGIMGGSAIVGSSVSLAVGSALVAKLEDSDRLSVAWCGDAVPETGQFWEALNFSIVHGLRVLFVIEDNGLSTATPSSVRSGIEIGRFNDHRYAATDDDSFEAVHSLAADLLDGHGYGPWPRLLRVKTTRACAHVGPEIDHAALSRHDPVADLRSRILSSSPDLSPILQQAEAEIRRSVDLAFERAEAADWPSWDRNEVRSNPS